MMKSLALAALACLAVPVLAEAQSFSFQTLDNPADPTFNQLLGINDSGVIAGYYGSGAAGHPNKGYTVAPPYAAFTPFNQPASVQTQATGINNAGDLTAFWSDSNRADGTDNNFGSIGLPTGKAYTFVSSTDPAAGGAPIVAQTLGINNGNVAAGFYNDANGVTHACTYDLASATFTEIKIKGAASAAATGINDNGQVSGFLTTKSGAMLGFVRNGNGGVVTKFSVPHSKTTQLLGINNAGVAVGFYMDAAGLTHGLYYTPSNGDWTQVDDPNGAGGTVLNGINNAGQLVGFYTDGAGLVHGMIATVTK